ncbi:MAG: outer membrane protein assembly factor BamD [Proteobacteria bacterium]|nr:MAG: outer membrane protein assembly factor BamD [Pseudomonadota bacterium]
MNQWKLLVIASLAISLSACSMLNRNKNKQEADKKVAAESTVSAQQLLRKGRENSAVGNYEAALKNFETLEARYPLGKFAEQAMLESAYASYKHDEPDTALDNIDRFMRMYPRSNRIDYALYLRGLVNFNRGGSIVDRVFPRSFSDLDGVRKKEAFHDFQKLLTRYPDSKYAPDAAKRVGYLRNSLGESEMNIAEYYMKRGAYLAAFNRAEYTLANHQGTPAVIRALQVKICAAKALKRDSIASDTARVLRLNFPEQTKIRCKY